MKKIHTEKPERGVVIGAPFDRLVRRLLKATNTNNLSSNWNRTDMTRYAIAELFKRTGEKLPDDARALLKRFDKDVDAA